MIDDKRVVVWCPYGRKRTVSILIKYLERDVLRGLIDEVWLYLNTDPDQTEDLKYAYELKKAYEWVKIKKRPDGVPRRTPKQRNSGYAYRYMIEPNTIYVRFDDDIIYVHDDAIKNLVEAKIRMETTLACFPIIWNNAVVSWYLQQCDKIPFEFGEVGSPYCMDPMGWANGEFAVKMHNLLLAKIEAKDVESLYLHHDMALAPRQQFSVSCFALDSADMLTLSPPGVLDYDEEEHWLTVHRPLRIGKDNIIVGNALVSHYTFFPQSRIVNATNILDRYRAIAEKL